MAGPGDFARRAKSGGSGPSFIDRLVVERMAYDAEIDRLRKYIGIQNTDLDSSRYNNLRLKRLVKLLKEHIREIDPDSDVLKLEYLDMSHPSDFANHDD